MEKIAILDFGGQYTHLIANRIRRLGVYSEIVQNDVTPEKLSEFKGIIFSGGPHSVFEKDSPQIDPKILELNIPILGICYGHQLISQTLGGEVKPGNQKEYGLAFITPDRTSPLFKGLEEKEQMWMSHGDAVEVLPENFEIIATTPECTAAAVQNLDKKIFGVQFHPEVTDSLHGMQMLDNFLDICGCEKTWTSENFVAELSEQVKKEAGDKKVFLLVSGGVDSTVAFQLLNKVLGEDRVLGLHIDNGLMREGESDAILKFMKESGFNNLHIYDASEEFLKVLEGKYEPEDKRNIIGTEFIEVKTRAQANLGLNADEWLIAQGTIYPDTIESAGTKHASKIKTHHNRVDVILELMEKGLIIEPLASLYKDEVRALGEALGIPHDLVWRHPFPGPGLGVRCLCSNGVEEKIADSDKATIEQMAKENGYEAVCLPVKSVGVQGDARTYAHPAVVFGERDYSKLEQVSTALTNVVKGINRVVYGLHIEGDKSYKLIEGYCTKDRLDKLRKIDHIVTEAINKTGEYSAIWQMPVVLLPLVNSNGDETVVLRPITSQEAMTARFFPLSTEAIDMIIAGAKEVDGIGDIFLDISNKPPGTIEWE